MKPSDRLVMENDEPQWRTLVASNRSPVAWPTPVRGSVGYPHPSVVMSVLLLNYSPVVLYLNCCL